MTNKTQNTTDHNRQAKSELRRLDGIKPTPEQIDNIIKLIGQHVRAEKNELAILQTQTRNDDNTL